ncbi:hypothetical protein ACEWY4_025244 [Coilia grayii]|uniref:Protein phosphatase 1 regulatory subunit 14B n=1 Tax=Coilia grayii TaxID=363190 RepID=A0ABD1IZL9_9TELE
MAAVTSPESSPQPRVYFQTPPGTEEPETPVRKQGRVTVKYDRKELRKRLNLEEWIIDQLTDLYDCESLTVSTQVLSGCDIIAVPERSKGMPVSLQTGSCSHTKPAPQPSPLTGALSWGSVRPELPPSIPPSLHKTRSSWSSCLHWANAEEAIPELEIDVDELLDMQNDVDRASRVKDLLVDCYKPTDDFVSELLDRIRGMQKLSTPQKK